jgi:HSP20 family molecular chaperone IbpA
MGTFGVARKEAPPRCRVSVREEPGEYTIELDVSEFAQTEVQVEAVGQQIKVRCGHDQDKRSSMPLSVHEQLEESFRLPDDADVEQLRAVYRDGTLVLSARRRTLTRRIVAVEPDYLVQSTDMGC